VIPALAEQEEQMKRIGILMLGIALLAGCITQTQFNETPEVKGIARAKADIAEGTMQILYYGKPWSQGKPLVDDQSGLPIKIVAGCCVTPEFVKETNAYNDIMRKKAKGKTASN